MDARVFLLDALVLILPVVFAGVGHMVVVRFRLFQALAVPIHAGWFGRNKTVRGLIVMAPLGVASVVLTQAILGVPSSQMHTAFLQADPLVLGGALGLAYVLMELPNSFLKRRAGIPPGEQARDNRLFFFLCDHLDSTLGCYFVYACALPLNPWHTFASLVVGPLIHVLVNLALFHARVRSTPF